MFQEQIKDFLKAGIEKAVNAQALPPGAGEVPLEVEKPTAPGFGDYFSNFGLLGAKILKMPPRKLGEILLSRLKDRPDWLKGLELAGAGFLNFTLSESALYQVLLAILAEGKAYGSSSLGEGRTVQLEFVSANPVGPLHIGHGRWAAVGDSLANLLSNAGFKVTREFYINDYGTQMELFYDSVTARYLQEFDPAHPFPEEGYQGEYIKALALSIKKEAGDSLAKLSPAELRKALGEIAYQKILAGLKITLEKMGVNFEVWFSEKKELREKKALEKAIELLKAAGYLYWQDGAFWFKGSSLGEQRDSVLIRQTGEPTYFLTDIAYHLNKFQRGFDEGINIWGADHAGHVPRMYAALKALGYAPERLKILIGQMVNLRRGNEPVRMSKRSGEMVTLDELLAEVGKDSARFIFLSKNLNSTLDFDLELAVKQNMENPVFYVQYAHARICSVFKTAKTQGIKTEKAGWENLALLSQEPELKILRLLERYPGVVKDCARTLSPHHLIYYLLELAGDFHNYYTFHRILSPDLNLSSVRLNLLSGIKQVLANALKILGLETPEQM